MLTLETQLNSVNYYYNEGIRNRSSYTTLND